MCILVLHVYSFICIYASQFYNRKIEINYYCIYMLTINATEVLMYVYTAEAASGWVNKYHSRTAQGL